MSGPRAAHRLTAALVCLLSCAAGWAASAYFESRDGLYRVSYASTLVPIAINRIHRWTLRLENADGKPVTGARFVVSGGMPIHDHGLPTEPRVTRELGDGNYLLEGMRFHMAGQWEIEVRIEADAGSDTAVIALEL